MYEVRNRQNEVLSTSESLAECKNNAEAYAAVDKQYGKNKNGPFAIYKVEQVWTTQMLDEAING